MGFDISVSIEAELSGRERPLEVRFRSVDLRGRRVRIEDPQDAEHEVLLVRRVLHAEFFQGHVAPVAVLGVGGPAAEDALTAVGFPHVQLAGACVQDRVYPLHRAQCGSPTGNTTGQLRPCVARRR